MGYRDDFYTKDNIIGYTGKLGSNPTVYFKKGKEYGHITQDHYFVTNIGRETVFSADDYTITNTGEDGVAEEKANGVIFHTSRNPFITANKQVIDILNGAIAKFQDEKAYPKNGGKLIDYEGNEFMLQNGELVRVKK